MSRLLSRPWRISCRGIMPILIVSLAGMIACRSGQAPPAQDPLKAQAPTVVDNQTGLTYQTNFATNERSLSEGGRWISGKSAGLDWGEVSVSDGKAIGHAGSRPYADSIALLKDECGPDQTAEARVYASRFVFNYPEVSLRLRSSIAPHRAVGYEVSNSLKGGDAAYLIIVKWNGPVGDFTYLFNERGAKYGVKDGDVVKATIAGDVITAYKNGVQMAQVKDSTFTAGSLGFGFNEGFNGKYGITQFTGSCSRPQRK